MQCRQVFGQHALTKHVTKPKGASAGTVQIKRESRLKVRPGVPDA